MATKYISSLALAALMAKIKDKIEQPTYRHIKCEYCDSWVDATHINCPNCGAPVKKEVNDGS